MVIIITTGDNESIAKVEWNDFGTQCRMASPEFGDLSVSEKTLRSFYECLDFLFGRPNGQVSHLPSLPARMRMGPQSISVRAARMPGRIRDSHNRYGGNYHDARMAAKES